MDTGCWWMASSADLAVYRFAVERVYHQQEHVLDEDGERYVLLIDPAATALGPLMERLLLSRQRATSRLWERSQWAGMTVAEALPDPLMLR